MLGSDHDGERANAGRLADRLVRDAGLTWPDVILPSLPSPKPPRDRWRDVMQDWPATWREAVSLCQGAGVPLPGKSRAFLEQLAGYGHRPSDAQLVWLRDIASKCRAGWGP